MHVLVVNYEWPGVTENCGGGGAFGKTLVDGLRQRGHEVTIVTDESDGHYATFPFRTYPRLSKTVRDANPDVIHGFFAIPSSVFLPRLANAHDVPYIVSVLGSDVYDPTRFTGIRPVADAVTRRVLSAADAVVAPSSDMQPRVREKYDRDPELVHLGIDPETWPWQPRTRSDQLRVLTVGRIVERKNLPAALLACSYARCQGLDVQWDIVGTGPLHDRYQEHWEHADWVAFHGYVDDLQGMYDRADVFLLPSYHESFGLVFVEALASGLPVVTSDTGGQTDIVSDGVGVTAPPDDHHALGGALVDIAREYDSYQSATEGHVDANFSAEEMVDNYESVYQRALP